MPAKAVTPTAEEAAKVLLYRRTVRRDFAAWCNHVINPLGQTLAVHHQLLVNELTSVASGDTERLMILMPPGSAKSTYASVLFPPWFLCQHPRSSLITASHTLDLAEKFGRKVRDLVSENTLVLNYALRADNQSAGRWMTTEGGEFYAVGVGGSVTGRRGDLIVIDDPVASREQAESKLVRDRTWDWFRSDLFTRLKPGGRIVLIQTRWHVDDLAGRLLEEMEFGGDQWKVIKLPAIAGDDDPIGRQPGDPLWPSWQPLSELERIRKTVGERDWASLYMQEPVPSSGALFLRDKIQFVDQAPPCVATARAWDLASSTKKSADYTAGVKIGRTAEGAYVVLDVKRFRGTPDQVEQAIVSTAREDGRSTMIGLPKDPGQAGAMQTLYLTRKLAGFRVDSSPESGAKEVRAMPVAAQSNAGNLALLRAPWNERFLDELLVFPAGKHDDQADALSRAFGMVIQPPAPARRIQLPFMAR